MAIKAEFVTSVARLDQLPKEDLPEIALAGRSNVGKSSLINKLVGRSGLARTSNTPGRTQTLNYYRITPDAKEGKPFFLVDMPGYGFAAVNKKARAQWKNLVEQYLDTRQALRGVVLLIDLRHPPQPLDHTMAAWLHQHSHNFVIVGTKADKVAKTKVPQLVRQIAVGLNVDPEDALGFSAQTGFGREQVWRRVLDTLENNPPTE